MNASPVPGSSQVKITPPGSTQAFWLGNEGHVSGLKYSSTYPGGCKAMSCNLAVPPSYRAEWLVVDSGIDIYRGAHPVWNGVLDEPVPSDTGWAVTGAGAGVQGADFLAIYSDTWPASQPDEMINNAIARGLPWLNLGVGSPAGMWTGQDPGSGAAYVDAVLNTMCSNGGLGWFVNSQPGGLIGNSLTLTPLPTAPTRLLVALDPVARTDGGDVSAIYVKYQVTADDTTAGTTATYGVTSVVNSGHGGKEQTLDLSNAGVMTAAAAQAVASQVLQIYVNSSFAGPFTGTYGQILTMGGVPVDPGTEQAGQVYQLILADFAYGGSQFPGLAPPKFIGAEFDWDDDALTFSLSPYQNVDSSLSALLSATSQQLSVTTSS